MKKFILLIYLSLTAICVNAQEHIRFNGATLGQSLENVASSLKVFQRSKLKHYEKYNCWEYTNGRLGNYKCDYYIDLNNKIVFEVSAHFNVNDLQSEVAPFIEVFDKKYEKCTKNENIGGHRVKIGEEETQTYLIRNKSNGKLLGEVSITTIKIQSRNISYDLNREGHVIITYQDYAAKKAAMKAYSNIMKEIL